MVRCKKCILPGNFPHVKLDAEGLCNYCREFEDRRVNASLLRRTYRTKFEKILKKVKGRNEYDILMCYSGGKDSTLALSRLVKDFKLDVLALTFDNGFIPERTYLNINSVVECLKVDHIFFKPDFSLIKKLFRAAAHRHMYSGKSAERASSICTTCMGLVKYTAIKTAVEKHIPMIGFGWSPGQAPVTSSILEFTPNMFRSMEGVFLRAMTEMIGPEVKRFFLNEKHYARTRFPVFVHPLAFFPYNEGREMKTIKRLGWKKPAEVEMNATNCLLNPYADEVHIKKYKYHPYVVEIATMVREGYMTRAEGLKHIPFKKNRKIVNMVKKKLGVN